MTLPISVVILADELKEALIKFSAVAFALARGATLSPRSAG